MTYLQQTLTAIGGGGVDAVVIGGPDDEQLYTLTSADRPYRVIVENMGEGAITVSENGVILYVNPHAVRLPRRPLDSMVGRDITEYVDRDQQPVLVSLLADQTESTRRAELRLHRNDGTTVPFLVAATDLDLEGVLVRCLVLTDLTMQKLVEHQVAAEVARNERQRGRPPRSTTPSCRAWWRPRWRSTSGQIELRPQPDRPHLQPRPPLDRRARRWRPARARVRLRSGPAHADAGRP